MRWQEHRERWKMKWENKREGWKQSGNCWHDMWVRLIRKEKDSKEKFEKRSEKKSEKKSGERSGGSRKWNRGRLVFGKIGRLIVAVAFLLGMFWLGEAAGYVQRQATTSDTVVILQSEDWGLGFGEEGKQPAGNASAEELAQYNAYYVGGSEEKIIYLTFDCGYENGNTAAILDALKAHDVRATFFVVGHFLETAPELVKRMVAEGHTVGNHTYHHPDMSAISSLEDFEEELTLVEELFREITGEEIAPYYRPPQGKYSAENLQMAKDLGYYTFFWSLAYVDWNQDSQPSKEEALEKLCGRIHPGAIVLLHNTSQTNEEILDELLTQWEELGYSFGSLSELCGK